ncbi:capsid protein [Discula destructiva virus 2]|uniref:Capsid protein n=1 Tax=Discula destructiva virus 2 TaxID=160484 RepID=Q91HI7_9VIRU|nr:capsid protein [Discula destructiva virus 2]AAK59380.1 capsid protein [Discula destructiva virus 2]
MADTSSNIPSSVTPNDSVSNSGKRKSKPGKAERLARRSAVGSQPGQAASASKAAMFSSGSMAPKPQPGKYPVVFQTGAGEPSRDQQFAISGPTISKTLEGFPERFSFSEKFTEFKANSGFDDEDFELDIVVSTLLRLSQQVVHSHVNMGLPQGDFAPVASTEVRVPGSVAAFVEQFGEHSVPAIGTRFLFKDYRQTVSRLVWAAEQAAVGKWKEPLERLWLPMSSSDGHTKLEIAHRLNAFLENAEVQIPYSILEDGVLSGTVPDAWNGIKGFLGDPPTPGGVDRRDRFDFLFKSYNDAPQLAVAFTTAAATAVLGELRLPWSAPSAGHLNWSFNAREAFTRLSDNWARKSTTYAKFFELSSSLSNRTAATGSQSQMALVSESDGITVVKTALALSPPEFSLVACFPASCLYSGELVRRVVVTTPLSVRQRATEFVQMDWRA